MDEHACLFKAVQSAVRVQSTVLRTALTVAKACFIASGLAAPASSFDDIATTIAEAPSRDTATTKAAVEAEAKLSYTWTEACTWPPGRVDTAAAARDLLCTTRKPWPDVTNPN